MFRAKLDVVDKGEEAGGGYRNLYFFAVVGNE